MFHMLALLPLFACAVMMFGAGALFWLASRTPLRRVPWIARRARGDHPAGPETTRASRG
jgi:hypothetical protein